MLAVSIAGVQFNPYLLGAGLIIALIGIWMRRWADRHSLIRMGVDGAKDVAFRAAKGAVKGEGVTMPQVPDEIAKKYADFQNAGSNVARAKMVAGTAVRGWLSTFVGLAGLLGLLVGLALMAAAFFVR
jgi:hypothetical protein